MKLNKLFFILFSVAFSLQASAKVTLHPLFTDNMVLQQQSEVNIWGQATPGKTVTMVTSWDGASYSALAGDDGKWKIAVSTPKAGGPYSITVSEKKKDAITLENVLIGDVWLCSGQSNMEMRVGADVTNMDEELRQADNHSTIRLFHVENTTSPTPSENLEVRYGGWQVCDHQTVEDFSATAYFFGKNLADSLNVPIGLIESCWGGTLAEAWTSAEALNTMPYFQGRVKKAQTIPQTKEEREALFKEDMAAWIEEVKNYDKAYENGELVWALSSYDDSSWKEIQVPCYYQDQGLGATDGFSWIRKTVDIPASWAGSEITLSEGVVDDNEFTYYNGELVGHTEGCLTWRKYTVPAELVKGGKTTIAIRVHDTGGLGGVVGEESEICLENGKGERIPLGGTWKYKMSMGLADAPDFPVNTASEPNFPTFLYNAMINPLTSFAIKGAIWYQGEANVARASQYGELMPLMINDWREKWGYEFPFYITQLANYMAEQTGPEESQWAELRESQLKNLHQSNTGLAVIIDIGEAADIHPKNKPEVGRRLALSALGQTYGWDIPFSGPLYKDYRLENGCVKISFSHTDNGLCSKGGELTGFYIAGADRVFHEAKAEIQDNCVVVSSDEVSFPVAVRYGWANNPKCNLYNGAGLPASPFRTDTWTK